MSTSDRHLEESAPLRERLEEITRDLHVENYPEKLAALSKDIPHSIKVLPSPGGEPLDRYNCVMHALGLTGRIEEPYVGWHFRVGLRFLRLLIDEGSLRPVDPSVGALVTWSSPQGLKHVGILVGPDRAVSKWSIGLLCEHGLFEVPASYGDQLKYYTPPEPDICETILRAIDESG